MFIIIVGTMTHILSLRDFKIQAQDTAAFESNKGTLVTRATPS